MPRSRRTDGELLSCGKVVTVDVMAAVAAVLPNDDISRDEGVGLIRPLCTDGELLPCGEIVAVDVNTCIAIILPHNDISRDYTVVLIRPLRTDWKLGESRRCSERDPAPDERD